MAAGLIGCGPPEEQPSDVTVEWLVTPDPARVGSTTVSVALRDGAGHPVQGAEVGLEGIMTHPGMQPSATDLRETQQGTYVGAIELTMAGDWILLLDASLPDGTTVQREHELPGVQSN